jgi:hypothetical protein
VAGKATCAGDSITHAGLKGSSPFLKIIYNTPMPEETTESVDSKDEVKEVSVEESAEQTPAVAEVPQIPEPAPSPPQEPPQPEPAKEPPAQEQPEETPAQAPAPPPTPAPEPIIEEPQELPPLQEVPSAPVPEKPPVKDEPEAEEPKLETTPPVVPPPPPIAETLPATPPLVPAVHDPKYTKDVPQRVLELTAEEINAARLLWARENIGQAQKQANRNRTARMNKRMDEIEAIVKARPQTTVHTIANEMQLPQKTTSSYLQKLVHTGRIRASGKTHDRRFYK